MADGVTPISATRDEASERWARSPHAFTCVEFDQAGIDPATVLADSVSADGYVTFELDENGKRRIIDSDGTLATVQHSWPDDETRDAVLEAARWDVRRRRLLGRDHA